MSFVSYYPPQSGGVRTYADEASLPASTTDGALAIALDTHTLFENVMEVTSGPVYVTLGNFGSDSNTVGSNCQSLKQNDLDADAPGSIIITADGVPTIVCTIPSTADAAQADHIIFPTDIANMGGTQMCIWLDIDDNGTEPDIADWNQADPPSVWVRVPIVTGNTAMQNAEAFRTAMLANPYYSGLSATAEISGGDITTYTWEAIAAPTP